MSAYNLGSPNAIASLPRLDALEDWIRSEFDACQLSKHEAIVLGELVANVDEFVKWPARPLLLWEGCTRKDKYHRYPEAIKVKAKAAGVHLDTRTNGPAIVAYLLAGGQRPKRYGSNNGWSIHHLYSGKFPATPGSDVTRAAQSEKHMTQAAGLVAIHPIADQACDEYPFFSWYLRAMSFNKFQYDPTGSFSGSADSFGFAAGAASCEVVC